MRLDLKSENLEFSCNVRLCVVFKDPVLFNIFGGYKAVVRPVPIPNTAVKHCIADGSACIACARVGCRQFFKAVFTLCVHGFSFSLVLRVRLKIHEG